MNDLMKTNFSYPEPEDPDVQYKLYKKREFYYNKFPEKPELKTYDDIKESRFVLKNQVYMNTKL